jgi:hypothetical protein
LDRGDSWVMYGSGDGWNGDGGKRGGSRRGKSPGFTKDARHGATGLRMESAAIAEEVDAEAAGGDGRGGVHGCGGGAGVAGGEALGEEFAV